MASISLSVTGRIVLVVITFLTIFFIIPPFFNSHSSIPEPVPYQPISNPQHIPDPKPPLFSEPESLPQVEPEVQVQQPLASSTSSSLLPAATLSAPSANFTFNTTLHSKAYGLTDSQCDSAFPGLFAEIDRAHTYRSTKGKLTPADIDRSAQGNGLIRLLIYSGQIYILHENTGAHKNRAASIISSIHRAVVANNEPVPDIEFTLSVADKAGAENQWALTRDMEEKSDDMTWVMTDHVWWSWPVPLLGEFNTIRLEIDEEEVPFDKKVPQLLWRGVVEQGPIRDKLVQATKGKSWANVSGIAWAGNGGLDGAGEEGVSAWDQCNFQYLAYTEGGYHSIINLWKLTSLGVSYSGRFKYLHQCNSVIITHKLKWAEYHSGLFVTEGEDQNIVVVERDFSDLDKKMTELLAHPERAKTIAENNAKTFRDRYLTPAAQACYVRKIINAWADVSDFQPKLWSEKQDGTGKSRKVLRGKPYETWLVEPMV
jgi:hypothetical protein